MRGDVHRALSAQAAHQNKLFLNLSIVVMLLATVLVMGFLWWRWHVAAGAAIDFS